PGHRASHEDHPHAPRAVWRRRQQDHRPPAAVAGSHDHRTLSVKMRYRGPEPTIRFEGCCSSRTYPTDRRGGHSDLLTIMLPATLPSSSAHFGRTCGGAVLGASPREDRPRQNTECAMMSSTSPLAPTMTDSSLLARERCPVSHRRTVR